MRKWYKVLNEWDLLIASFLASVFFVGIASGNVTVDIMADRIIMADGSVIEGSVLCRGSDSIIVLVGETERTLPTSSVIRVERGSSTGERRTFGTVSVGGHEVIIGAAAVEAPVIPEKKVEEPAKKRRSDKAEGGKKQGKKKDGRKRPREKKKPEKSPEKKPEVKEAPAEAFETGEAEEQGRDKENPDSDKPDRKKPNRKMLKQEDLMEMLEILRNKFGGADKNKEQ